MYLVAATLLVSAPASVSMAQRGSSITVRVLNARNGKPLKGVVLFLYAQSNIPIKTRKGQDHPLATEITNPDGIAIFQLRESIGEVILSYGDSLYVGRCTPSLPFATAEILKTGIIGTNTCSGDKFEYKAAPKPGELVLFGKKWSWWERIKHSE